MIDAKKLNDDLVVMVFRQNLSFRSETDKKIINNFFKDVVLGVVAVKTASNIILDVIHKVNSDE